MQKEPRVSGLASGLPLSGSITNERAVLSHSLSRLPSRHDLFDEIHKSNGRTMSGDRVIRSAFRPILMTINELSESRPSTLGALLRQDCSVTIVEDSLL
jgi:hypothetical protein